MTNQVTTAFWQELEKLAEDKFKDRVTSEFSKTRPVGLSNWDALVSEYGYGSESRARDALSRARNYQSSGQLSGSGALLDVVPSYYSEDVRRTTAPVAARDLGTKKNAVHEKAFIGNRYVLPEIFINSHPSRRYFANNGGINLRRPVIQKIMHELEHNILENSGHAEDIRRGIYETRETEGIKPMPALNRINNRFIGNKFDKRLVHDAIIKDGKIDEEELHNFISAFNQTSYRILGKLNQGDPAAVRKAIEYFERNELMPDSLFGHPSDSPGLPGKNIRSQQDADKFNEILRSSYEKIPRIDETDILMGLIKDGIISKDELIKTAPGIVMRDKNSGPTASEVA